MHFKKKILFHSLTPLWIYISIEARLLSTAALLIISSGLHI